MADSRDESPRASLPLSPADEEMIRAVRRLIAEDRIMEAMEAVERMSTRPQLRWIGRRLIAASRQATRLGFAPGDQARTAVATVLADIHRQDRSVPTGDGGPLVIEKPGAEQVVVVFSGNEQAPFAHVVLQSYLRRRPCHAIYVADPRRLFGVGGLPGLGGDLAATARNLRILCDRLGARQRFCFGFSGNGYAAMRHALEIDAEAVLAFSPPTKLNLRRRQVETQPMIRRLHEILPHMAQDLRPLYRARHRLPATTIVYGAASQGDTRYARRMEELPNLRLVPIPGYAEHDSLSVAIVSGRLSGLIDRMLAGRAIDNPDRVDGAP